jgi:multidrug efflux system outer membrane protein
MEKRYRWLIPLMIVLLASCHITRKYRQPASPAANLYRDSTGADTTSIASIPWNSFFTDTLLQQMIAKGLAQNLDLKIAVQRIIAARATFRQSKAVFLPDLNANATVKRSRLSYPQGFGIINSSTQYDLGLSAGWEADIWGKLRSAKRAALAELLQNEAVQRAVQTQLIADIAGNYYRLLALDAQLLILEKTAQNRQEDVRTMKLLKESNVVNGAAVVQSEANQYAAEVAIPAMKRQIRETENVLNVLLASAPGSIPRSSLGVQQLRADLQTGIPAQLLQNRPDVIAAEYAFRAAFETTNVARTYFYPSINITAAAGFSSFSFSDWISADGLFANIAGGIAQPILSKGLNKARLATAEARQQEALYNFQQSLYVAGQEVSDALFSYHTAVEQQATRARQLQSLEKSVAFTKKLLHYSTATNYTDVLTSEQSLLTAQLDDVNDKLLQWQAVISLYRALGGGWR